MTQNNEADLRAEATYLAQEEKHANEEEDEMCPLNFSAELKELDEQDLNDLVSSLVIRISNVHGKLGMQSIESRLFRLCERVIELLPNEGRKVAARHGLLKAMGIDRWVKVSP